MFLSLMFVEPIFLYPTVTVVFIFLIYFFYIKFIRIYTFSNEVPLNSNFNVFVSKVGDGDGFTGNHYKFFKNCCNNISTMKFRLAGIDAPETRYFKRKEQPFSNESKLLLKKLIYKKIVNVKIVGIDRYNRLLVIVFIKKWFYKKNINLIMLEEGLACVYTNKDAQYGNFYNKMIEAEKNAEKQKKGIWSIENYLLPMDYKKNYKTNV